MLKYIFLCSMIAAGYILYSTFPESHGPGIMAKEDPIIRSLSWQEPFTFKGSEIIPRKTIEAEVQVIKKKRYFFDDFKKYSTIDAVVGWDKLSDQRNLDYLYFSLEDRSYDIEISSPPVSVEEIYNKTALFHLIPATSEIDNKIKKLRNGNIIKIKGLFVDINDVNQIHYKTMTNIPSTNKKQEYILWAEEIDVR